MIQYRFTVFGVPIPKGSHRAFMRPGMKYPVVTDDNPKTRPWSEAVTAAALVARGGYRPITDPVAITVRFFLPRPSSAPKRVTAPAKKPDLDKLLRSVKDGLTRAGIYRDDSQVTRCVMSKDFAGGALDPEGDHGVPRAVVGVTLATYAGSECLAWVRAIVSHQEALAGFGA